MYPLDHPGTSSNSTASGSRAVAFMASNISRAAPVAYRSRPSSANVTVSRCVPRVVRTTMYVPTALIRVARARTGVRAFALGYRMNSGIAWGWPFLSEVTAHV